MRQHIPVVLTALALATLLTACARDEVSTKPDAASCLVPGQPTVVAAAVRTNSPAIALPKQVIGVLNAAVVGEKQIALVRLDGQPRTIFDQSFVPRSSNEQGRKAELSAFRGTLNAALSGSEDEATDIRARIDEVDVLEALTIAGSTAGRNGNVVLIDSGLQTLPPLDFRDGGLLAVPPDTIVEYLKANDLLPDLTDRQVFMGGLGSTAAPQQDLDNRLDRRIAEIWAKIAKASGAACVQVDPTIYTSPAPAVQAKVSTVALPPLPRPPSECTETSLGESDDVGFLKNSAEFRTPDAAKATIKKIADVMIKEEQTAELVGSTSSEGPEDRNQTLSEQRAEAVKNVLVALGASKSRITARGAGEFLPGRVDDTGQDGVLDLAKAVQNRKVVVKLNGTRCPK